MIGEGSTYKVLKYENAHVRPHALGQRSSHAIKKHPIVNKDQVRKGWKSKKKIIKRIADDKVISAIAEHKMKTNRDFFAL